MYRKICKQCCMYGSTYVRLCTVHTVHTSTHTLTVYIQYMHNYAACPAVVMFIRSESCSPKYHNQLVHTSKYQCPEYEFVMVHLGHPCPTPARLGCQEEEFCQYIGFSSSLLFSSPSHSSHSSLTPSPLSNHFFLTTSLTGATEQPYQGGKDPFSLPLKIWGTKMTSHGMETLIIASLLGVFSFNIK